jgi:hypothetical protein
LISLSIFLFILSVHFVLLIPVFLALLIAFFFIVYLPNLLLPLTFFPSIHFLAYFLTLFFCSSLLTLRADLGALRGPLILHMLPASVHLTGANALKDATNVKISPSRAVVGI